MSSIPLGENLIKIRRGLTTSSTAIFVPFTVQELFQRGEALYYGLNSLSNNMILCDRKLLKNPKGSFRLENLFSSWEGNRDGQSSFPIVRLNGSPHALG